MQQITYYHWFHRETKTNISNVNNQRILLTIKPLTLFFYMHCHVKLLFVLLIFFAFFRLLAAGFLVARGFFVWGKLQVAFLPVATRFHSGTWGTVEGGVR